MSDEIIEGCGWEFDAGDCPGYLIVKPAVLMCFQQEPFDVVWREEEKTPVRMSLEITTILKLVTQTPSDQSECFE